MSNSREISQLASFITVDDVTKNIGITSGTTPFVGIGSTLPTVKLDVLGNVKISGIVTATTFVGTLTGTAATVTTGNITTLSGSDAYYNTGIVTTLSGTNLTYTNGNVTYITGTAATITTGNITTLSGSDVYYNTGITTTLSGTNLTYTNGSISALTGTAATITTGNITTLSGSNAYYNIGIVTSLVGTALTYTSGNINTLSGSNAYYNTGIITTLSGTNINYSGISTLGSILINAGIISATSPSGIVTYYGDGRNLTGVNAFNVINQTLSSSVVYPTFANSVGVTSIGISTTQVVFIPSTGNLGIGTTNPTSKLEVNGTLGFSTYLWYGATTAQIKIGDSQTGKSLLPSSQNANILIGVGAGSSLSTGDYNTFIGQDAGYFSNSDGNTLIGERSGYFNTTGFNNVFVGRYAGVNNTTGYLNSFFGQSAGVNNTTGDFNVAVGEQSGSANESGSRNVYLGAETGISVNASNKIIIGSGDGFSNKFDSPDTEKNTQLAIGVRTDSNESKYWLVGNENFNIGIGTTNPTSKLQVSGDVSVSGVVTATTFYGNVNATGGSGSINVTNINAGVGTITSLFGTNLNYSGVSTVAGVQISAGIITAVGVGTVVYYGDGSKLIGVNAFNVIQQNVLSSPVYPTLATNIGVSSVGISSTGLVFIPSSNSLGIGTTTPSTNLDVNGNVRIRGGIYDSTNAVGNSGYVLTSNGSSIVWQSAGGVGIVTNSGGIDKQLQYNRAGIFSGTNQVYYDYNTGYLGISTSTPKFNLEVVGGIGATTLTISGVSTFVGGPVLIGSGTSTGTASQRLQITGGAYISGNLGLGVTNPTTRISIAGTTGISFADSNIRLGNEFTGSSITSGSNNNFLGNGAGQSNTTGYDNNFFGYYAGSANIDGNFNNFFGPYTGGMNTSGSSNNFIGNFAGQFNTTGSDNIFIGPSAGSNNQTGSENVIIGKDQNAPILNGSNQLVIGAGSTSWITGNSSYNVGIGTTNPTSKLQVVGNVSITGISTLGSVSINAGIISATSPSGIVTYYGDGRNLTGVNAFNVINQTLASSPVYPTLANNVGVSSVGISSTGLVFIPSTGNLGIGTTNPAYKLDVAGDINSSTSVKIKGIDVLEEAVRLAIALG